MVTLWLKTLSDFVVSTKTATELSGLAVDPLFLVNFLYV